MYFQQKNWDLIQFLGPIWKLSCHTVQLQVRKLLGLLFVQEKPSSLEERVELGHGVSMQATVPDPSHIFVSIGLGFYAELTWEEALQVTALKKAAIQQKLDASKATVAKIQLHAKLVAEGLEGLSRLTAE